MTQKKELTEAEKVAEVEKFTNDINMAIEKKMVEIFGERKAFVIAINIEEGENPKNTIASNLEGENLVLMGVQISDVARQVMKPQKKKAPVIAMPRQGIITKH